jgi:hypothetical protein
LPRLRPGEPVRCIPVHPPAARQESATTGPAAVGPQDDLVTAGPAELPAGPGCPPVRRGGPRHGRRTTGGPGAAPVLAGAAGLVLGLCLGAAGWAACANESRQPGLTEREIAVALREARLAQLEHRLATPGAAARPQQRSR